MMSNWPWVMVKKKEDGSPEALRRKLLQEFTRIIVDETILTRYNCMVIIDPTLGSLNQQIAIITHLPRGPH